MTCWAWCGTMGNRRGRASGSGGGCCCCVGSGRSARMSPFLGLGLGLRFCPSGSHWAGLGWCESGEDGCLGLYRDAVARSEPHPWDKETAKKSERKWTAACGCCGDNRPLVMKSEKSKTTRMMTGKCHEYAENVAVSVLVEVRDPPFQGLARGSTCRAGRSAYLGYRHSMPESAPFSSQTPPCGSFDWHIDRGGYRRYSERF